MSHVGIA